MKRILTLALILSPSVALAHPGHGAGFLAGLDHPFSGMDHMLAMVAVGVWAAVIGGRAMWALPLAFVAAMLAGGGLGMAGVALPGGEPVILASVIVLGVAAGLLAHPPMAMALAAVALFGLAHGNAHGLEAPATGFAGFAAGFVLATVSLHGAGLLAGRAMVSAQRLIGFGIAGAGVLLALA
jgi:urease accessory protein